MVDRVRMTISVATVLNVFLHDVDQPRYGYELMQLTGFPSGKLYPILARLEGAGWLEKHWENIDPAAVGRPARRWYRLGKEGAAAARSEIAALHQQLTPRPAPSGTQVMRPGHGVA